MEVKNGALNLNIDGDMANKTGSGTYDMGLELYGKTYGVQRTAVYDADFIASHGGRNFVSGYYNNTT